MGPRDIPADHPGRSVVSGRTPLWASQVDQRFSWCLYVPTRYDDNGPPHRVVVGIHGNLRDVTATRVNLVELGEDTGTVVVTPLFPWGVERPNDVQNLETVRFGAIASTSFCWVCWTNSIPRPVAQESPHDRDVHSGQHYVALLDIAVE